MASWDHHPPRSRDSRLIPLIATALTILFLLLFAAALTLGVRGAGAEARQPTRAVFGHGMIRYGGLGPEAWRWQTILADRRADRLQQRLTARVLEIRSLNRQVALLQQMNLDPLLAIRVVFGRYADQAIRVASCETGRTFHTGAQNGQYLGIFQMGRRERALYGHGPTALEQARAAYRYFVASGRDWSPWECQP